MSSHNSLCPADRGNPLLLIVSFAVLWSTPAWSQIPATRPAPASPANVGVPFLLKAVRVDPTSIASGQPAQGIVDLLGVPGPRGVTVTLESSPPQLAGVPLQVTITPPMVSATFNITTRPVNQDTTLTIKAREGPQTREANLQIRRPTLESAYLEPPSTCNGNPAEKGTVHYTLTGPPFPDLKIHGDAHPVGIGGGAYLAIVIVPTGSGSTGSFGIRVPECPYGGCYITGFARIENYVGPASSVAVFPEVFCNRPPLPSNKR